MGRRRTIALAIAIVVVGGAAAAVVAAHDGGGRTAVDSARLQSDIAARLPAGWTDTVDRDGATVNVRLVHKGGMTDIIRALKADDIVNPDKPEMMRLLPADHSDVLYLFHYSDTVDKGTVLRVAAGKGHRSPHPELQFMSRDFVAAQLRMLPPATPTVIDIP